jgi:ribonucleotide reductase alpha subunit
MSTTASGYSADMYVVKRDGTREPVSFDKVLERIRKAATGLTGVNYTRIAQLVLAEIRDGIRTTELDELSARLAISYMTVHPDWATLAAQIIISNCQRSAPATFSAAMEELASLMDVRGRSAPALADDVIAFIRANAPALDAMIQPANDFLLDYFGFKTLEKAYLMRGRDKQTVETPQYMWLRVAVGLWGCHHASEEAGGSRSPEDVGNSGSSRSPEDKEISLAERLANIQETYTLMSQKAFTHATPTLFNAGTPRPQCSSCFLISMKSDSIEGIFDTIKECAQISKYSGGIGLHIHNIRAQGSHIAGTNGTSDGIIPMLRVFNNTARYVNQGGRRNGSFAIYLEPWHADVQQFLKMKSNTGSEEERARDLFYALWIPDLFMRRVESGGDWSLFCPHEAPGLADVHGAEFTELYERYEREGRARRAIPAQKLWSEILVSQIETGTPYLLYKDAANAKSNQKNLGTIKSSNLCVAPDTLVEIYGPDTHDEWHGLPLPRSQTILPICDLDGQEVTVWNGEGFSQVTVRKTGVSQQLLTVIVKQTFVDGHSRSVTLDCTPYHKFLLHANSSLADCPRLAATDLRHGMRLCDHHTESGRIVQQEVVFVHDHGLVADTYCYTEHTNHVGIFNGIMTGQCTEIMEYSSPEETAVCNLASIALPFFVAPDNKSFDFIRLAAVTDRIVKNLNRVIDINFYPTPETRRSNMRHRPIGLGVQGLADVFARLGLAWETPEAAALNQKIFEVIYYAALHSSAKLAAKDGPYETYIGSPASKGELQPDMWGLAPSDYKTATSLDWATLRNYIKEHGLRNSLLVAPMPTASTSQILGYNECIEPFTTNIYARRTLAGEFTVINKYLVADLLAVGLWNTDLKDRIVAANGSVQGIAEIPEEIKARYKTVWEIKQKTLIDMAADRGAFICQSQSLNLFVADPTIAKLSSMHFYAWKRGLKTGIYYLRTKSAVQAIKFTLDPRMTAAGGSSARLAEVAAAVAEAGASASSSAEPQDCLLCSS